MTDDREVELKELLAEVRRIDVLARRLVTDVMAGGYSSVFRGSGIEFDHVREYADGDAQRSVDWNVTARVGRPFVKTYVDERELTVLFLLDLSGSMGGGFGVLSARQIAARVCGCLALAAIRNNDKVGLIGFSDTVDRYVPPKKGADTRCASCGTASPCPAAARAPKSRRRWSSPRASSAGARSSSSSRTSSPTAGRRRWRSARGVTT